MAVAGVFNIHPDNLRLGAVRARGSPGVTLYEADLFYPLLPLNVQTHGGMPCSARQLLLDIC